MKLPYVKIDLLEHTVFWEPWTNEAGEPFYGPHTSPFEAYQHYFCWFNWVKGGIQHGKRWGYEWVYHDCLYYEAFCLRWFAINWTTEGSAARCKKREQRAAARRIKKAGLNTNIDVSDE